MDHNMDFGMNLAQDAMSSSEKREKNFQPGYGDDMRNATQSFLAAEMGGGFVEPAAKPTSQDTPVHNLFSQDPGDFQSKNFEEQNRYEDQHYDDEFENDSLNFSANKPMPTVENVKFISSTDLMDDFGMPKNSQFNPEKAEEKIHQLVSDGVSQITASVGNPVNLEFKVEPDNVKLISSDTLLDDFEPSQPVLIPTAKEHSNDFEIGNKPYKETKTNLMDDFGISDFGSQPSNMPESQAQQFSDNEDDIFKSPLEFSPSKQKPNAESDNEKFISAENFGIDDFRSKIVPEAKFQSAVIDDIKEKASDILKPNATSSATSKNVFKTEPPKTNILQGEVVFHTPSGRGKSNLCNYPLVESLVYWRDVKISGIVFGAGLVLLLALSLFSVISVFAYTSLLILTGTVGFRIYKYGLGLVNDTHEGHPFEAYLNEDFELSQERVKQITNTCAANLNAFISELKKLFLVEDYIESIKFAVILLILVYVGAWFNGMTLIILAYILAFAVPPLYEQNKHVIDDKLELISTKIAEISGLTFGRSAGTETGKNK